MVAARAVLTQLASVAVVVVVKAAAADIDATWSKYLEQPPEQAAALARELAQRADGLAAVLPRSGLALHGDLDVVVSGGGDYDAYYMGIAMVLDRAARLSGGFTMQRYAGASAGGMMPFEWQLKGENATVMTHLAYGVLTGEFPSYFSNTAYQAYYQDHHWRIMAAWQTQKYAERLSSLNDRVFLAISCLEPFPTLNKISTFTAAGDQATHAFMATGTYTEWYQGKLCSDGGSTSGPKMTPLFQDGVRPQLIVDLMTTGYPTEAAFTVDLPTYTALVKKGQDDAAAFLRTGTSPTKASITLCPKGAHVSTNVCQTAEPSTLLV